MEYRGILNDSDYCAFAFRLMKYANEEHLRGEDLLKAALEGRELSTAAVLKLVEIAWKEFKCNDQYLAERHRTFPIYRDAALEWLKANELADVAEKLVAARCPVPKKRTLAESQAFWKAEFE